MKERFEQQRYPEYKVSNLFNMKYKIASIFFANKTIFSYKQNSLVFVG